jgi:hypothetical protein
MTMDHPLRRALAHVCSAKTMSRVVDPIFADIRWEDGRVTWRGCVSLVKALALYGLTSVPSRFAAACSDDGYALLRAAALTSAGALIVAIALTASPLSPGRHIHTSLYALGVRLVPQALVFSLPAMLILAIPAVLGGIGAAKSIVGRALLLTAAGLVTTIALMVGVLPRANQYYLPGTRQSPLAWGPRATGFEALRAQIREFQQTDGGHSVAQRLEYTFQLRAAVMVSAVPLGIAGLAIATLTRRRRLSVSMAACALAAYWTLMVVEESVANAQIIRGGFLPEYLCAWTPNLLMLIASFAILGVRYSGNRPSAASRMA